MKRRTVLGMLCSAAVSSAEVRPWSAATQAGLTYLEFGRRAMAEEQFKRALFQARSANADDPIVAECLDRLASATRLEEPRRINILQESLAIRKRALGPDHPETARSLTRLAMATSYDGPGGQVEGMLADAARIAGRDPQSALMADVLEALGASRHGFYRASANEIQTQVAALYRAALVIRSRLPGADGLDLALTRELDQLTLPEEQRTDVQTRQRRQEHLEKLTGRATQPRDFEAAPEAIPPAVLSRAEPEWSEFAAKVRVQGTVKMDVIVTEQGSAGAVRLTRSLGLGLDEQAYFAIREWRFRPAEFAGRAAPAALALEVNFHR